jgi:hypothetical protein
MANNLKKTSTDIASKAASILNNRDSSAIAKSLAASALSQSGTNHQTGAEMEEKAGRVLSSTKYSDETKALAASVLSQSNKSR